MPTAGPCLRRGRRAGTRRAGRPGNARPRAKSTRRWVPRGRRPQIRRCASRRRHRRRVCRRLGAFAGEDVRDRQRSVDRDGHAVARAGRPAAEQREQGVAADEPPTVIDNEHPVRVAVVEDPEVGVGRLNQRAGSRTMLGGRFARPTWEPAVTLTVERLDIAIGVVEYVSGDPPGSVADVDGDRQ